MAFHFPLETVLQYWASVEHQQELRLRAANQQVAGTRRLIERVEAALTASHHDALERLTHGTTAAEMQFGCLGQAALLEQRRALFREVSRLEQLREQQQKIFHRIRRQRETFESLRDHQRNEYEIQSRRRDQRQLDHLWLLRQAYLRRG